MKILAVICSLCLLWCLVLSFTSVSAFQEHPKVSVLRWLGSGDHIDWEYENISSDAIKIKEQDDETVYIVSPHIYALSISCNASYPVQWVCTGTTCTDSRRPAYLLPRTRSYREAQSIDNTKSFKFSSILEITTDSSGSSGSYSCQSVSSERMNNNIYVYCLGDSPPYFILAGQSVHVKSKDNNQTIVLPCHVSSPDAQVVLQKETGGSYLNEPESPYINYDPRVGFTLKVQQLGNPYGSYKCIIDNGDNEDDFVLITSLKDLEQNRTEVMKGNATFGYDPVANVIRCCATGSKPPNMYSTYCEDANNCKIAESHVMKGGNNALKLHNSSCSVFHPYYRDTGVLRCKGDGIDVIRHYFTSFEDHRNRSARPTVYFNWFDADPAKFMVIEPHTRGAYDGRFYSNQTLFVSCDTSTYYFAEGLFWSINWRNGTVQFLDDSYSAFSDYQRSLRTIKIMADVEMVSLTCYAPIWNTTDWVNSTYQLNIYQSEPPTLVGPPVQVIHWAINSTNVTVICNVDSGKPSPYLRWRKGNRIVLNTTNVKVSRGNGSSILKFKNVYEDIAGEYHCLAGNVAGKAERVVRIVVDIPSESSSIGAAGITIIVLVLLALSVGLGFLVWRMKLQKKIIDHLTGVVFRDMSSPSQGIIT